MLTLGITTSTSVVGVAIADESNVLAHLCIETDRRHAEELTPMLLETVTLAGVAMKDLHRLAVDVGPGRFTGLRVGVATIGALAFALDLEVVPMTSLELLAIGTGLENVAAVIDARRSEVFQQIFAGGVADGAAVVGDPELLGPSLTSDVVAVGDGADRFTEFYPNHLAKQTPSAALLVQSSRDRTAMRGADVRPLYMRQPDVQINIRTRP